VKKSRRLVGHVPLNRALSKLRILSRAQATAAIRAGRVSVDGRVVHEPLLPVVPEQTRIVIDGQTTQPRRQHRTIAFHKPRGVVTTRSDPQGRPTIFDLLGDAGEGLVAVGRLDLATSGLLVLTSNTQLANWLTDPRNALPRTYVVTVRGRVTDAEVATLRVGISRDGNRLQPSTITLRKASGRESHLVIELTEGKNREIRRLFAAIGHEVTALKRVGFGAVALGTLAPGAWRAIGDGQMWT